MLVKKCRESLKEYVILQDESVKRAMKMEGHVENLLQSEKEIIR